jgi:FkbM family methyltransferase
MLQPMIREYLGKLETIVFIRGAFRARLAGCYLSMYKYVYDLFLRGLRPQTVLDIGANRGMFSKCTHFVFPEASIYAFEPLKDCYDDLCQLKKTIRNFQCYNAAVAERTGESFIYRSSYEYSSSLLEMAHLHKEAFPYSAGHSLEKVNLRTLDSMLDTESLRRPVLMKIDVQGYEKCVLLGAGKTLEHTDYVVCEMSLRSLYEGQPLFDEVYRYLTNLGFCFSGQLTELRHPKSCEILQIDGLFLRTQH